MQEDDGSKDLANCNSCGQRKLCIWTEDPYASEINDDHTEMWLCDDCYRESSMDI